MYSSAKRLQRVLSANEIRKTFIDFFVANHNHKYVRSSPVLPFCDPTVAFVNAGMNQFKSVFLGKCPPPSARVANSQKCVRVGGKHNDLDVVGKDSYHHTFFEMLGNWSFGDYFKREACEMAINLLQGPFQIDTNRLYVTYFAGDKTLGLPADVECYEIWRSLGFPPHKIVPFGAKDNFWEMGTTGPCGPCTEIHYDHRPDLGSSAERAKLINTGRPDLTELWNLVFIQYNRNPDATISPLPDRHVDTGMGFERLTALLQNKASNYDTDLFTPFFDTIQKISKAPPYSGCFPDVVNQATLDTGYRILADHVRMIAVCLSDGMLPDQNQKLRRVLRRAFKVSEQVFNNESLILELIPVAVDTLGTAYTELYGQQASILELVSFEQEVFKSVRQKSTKAFAEVLTEFPNLRNIDLMEYPGFVPAYRDFQAQRNSFVDGIIPGKFLFKLFDTYGLNEESFNQLSDLVGMTCDLDGYKQELLNAKLRSKSSFCSDLSTLHSFEAALRQLTRRLPDTNNSFKYLYAYDSDKSCYNIENLTARVEGMVLNDKEITAFKTPSSNLNSNETRIAIITDKSNFYYASGGQQTDTGAILLKSKGSSALKLKVVDVKFMNNCVIHICTLPDSQLSGGDFEIANGDEVILSVDVGRRQANMLHHTATHLLNGALRGLFKKVTYQVSSAVTEDQCKFEFAIIGKRITKDDIKAIDEHVNHVISSALPVVVETFDATQVMQQQDDITLVPGEIYPETGLRLVSISCEQPVFQSKELCCGTHVTNTKEMQYFCVTNLKLTNRARYAITAVAGIQAEKALKSAALLEKRVDVLEQQCSTELTSATEIELQKIRNNILHSPSLVLPYVMRTTILERIAELLKRIKSSTRTTLNEFIEVEMKNLLLEKPKQNYPFLVHYIRSSALVEEMSLQRATKLCLDRPILVVGMCDGVLKARCCVPTNFVTQNFNAEKWLREFASPFGAHIVVKKGQDSTRVCSLKGKKVATQFEEQLEDAMNKSNEFAMQNVTFRS